MTKARENLEEIRKHNEFFTSKNLFKPYLTYLRTFPECTNYIAYPITDYEKIL